MFRNEDEKSNEERACSDQTPFQGMPGYMQQPMYGFPMYNYPQTGMPGQWGTGMNMGMGGMTPYPGYSPFMFGSQGVPFRDDDDADLFRGHHRRRCCNWGFFPWGGCGCGGWGGGCCGFPYGGWGGACCGFPCGGWGGFGGCGFPMGGFGGGCCC